MALDKRVVLGAVAAAVVASGAHFGQLLVTPGLTLPVHATGSFAARRTGSPPWAGITNSSASAWSYMLGPTGKRL